MINLYINASANDRTIKLTFQLKNTKINILKLYQTLETFEMFPIGRIWDILNLARCFFVEITTY